MKNTNILLILAFVLLSTVAFGQTDYTRFYRESMSTNNTGMYILGSWAVLNIATGAAGWAKGYGDSIIAADPRHHRTGLGIHLFTQES